MMELKTYQAPSMSEALAKVKGDLGPDAMILHTRNVKRGGILGFGAKSLVEITATNDERVGEARGAANAAASRVVPPNAAIGGVARMAYAKAVQPMERSKRSDIVEEADDAQRKDVLPAAADEAIAQAPSAETPARTSRIPEARPIAAGPQLNDTAVHRDIEDIRGMVERLLIGSHRAEHPELPEELIEHYARLIGQDVAEEVAVRLMRRITSRLKDAPPDAAHWDEHGRFVPGSRFSDARIREELRAAMCEMLPASDPIRLPAQGRPTVVALVGPTGVGKTTTIAKLAAVMKLREGKSVGLITIDTYRIAAVEQLKTYAEILDVQLASVVTAEDMRQALASMSKVDLILIDTAGRSQRDEPRIAELGALLEVARPHQVHLVLSTTSREATIKEAVRNFALLGAQHVILTKIDEAVGFGVMLNVFEAVEMRLSYLTMGQSVPSDIEEGSASRIVDLILSSPSEAEEAANSPRLNDDHAGTRRLVETAVPITVGEGI